MKAALALALLLPLAGAGVPDSSVHTIAGGAPTARIPFHFVANQVRVDVRIGERGPFHLILDTGMPSPGLMLIENERIAALGLSDTGKRVQVAGGGGEGQAANALLAEGVAFALGPLSIAKGRALVLPRPEGFPPSIDGVIGGELFFRYVVRIDMDKKELVLSQPEGWSPPQGACSVPLVREGGMLFVDLRVAVGAEEPVGARVVVDIGASHALSLNGQPGQKFDVPAGAIETSLGRGVSGVVLGKAGRVRRVELGEFAFEAVVVNFPGGAHQRPGGGDVRDGILGEEILKRFNLTVDYVGERMVLEKAQGFGEPFEIEMAGLAADWQSDATVKVRSVLPGSPAAEAQILPGDVLLAIDGKALSELREDGLRQALRAEGKEIRIELRRGEERLEKRVRLKRLV